MDLIQRSLVTVDGNDTLPSLSQELMKCAFLKLRGDDERSTLHIYNVDASGENANGRRPGHDQSHISDNFQCSLCQSFPQLLVYKVFEVP